MPAPSKRPNGTPNGFFLTIRDGEPYCLIHEAPVTGGDFPTREAALAFVRDAHEWYTTDTGPAGCVFRHPEPLPNQSARQTWVDPESGDR